MKYLLYSILFATGLSYPGLVSLMDSLRPKIEERQVSPPGADSIELIGDLRFGGPLSAVGRDISAILTGSASAQSTTEWQGGLSNPDAAKCQADKCCVWRHIALEMEKMFRGANKRCTAEARAAVRLGFHDAGTWSKFTEDYGGADGSILLSGLNGGPSELVRPENNGLQHIAGITIDWWNKYKKYNVSMADLIQMGANVATVVCPLGPRVRTFIGRRDSNRPAIDGLLPDVHAKADHLIEQFENKTIKVHGLTALLGAHTVSQQHFVDPSFDGLPQDTTPGIWDVKFYEDTMAPSTTPPIFKLPSDIEISQHPSASTEWRDFAVDQSHWNEDYAREYVRLSLLGVNNINSLVECSHVLPRRTPKKPDE